MCKYDVIHKNRKYVTYQHAARGQPSQGLHKNLVKIGRVFPEISSRTYEQTDRQRDRQAHHILRPSTRSLQRASNKLMLILPVVVLSVADVASGVVEDVTGSEVCTVVVTGVVLSVADVVPGVVEDVTGSEVCTVVVTGVVLSVADVVPGVVEDVTGTEVCTVVVTDVERNPAGKPLIVCNHDNKRTKYITYHNADRGGPSHGLHKNFIDNFIRKIIAAKLILYEDWTCSSARMLPDK